MSEYGEPPQPTPDPTAPPPRPVLPVEEDEGLPPLAAAYYPPRVYYPPPVPVVPLPPPDFASTGYTSLPPSRERRPGVVTWLGVGSVAAGCVGILVSVAIAIGAVVFLAAADAAGRDVATAAANRASAAAVAPAEPAPGVATTPGGMTPQERAAVIDAMKYVELIGPDRERQFDTILAKAGTRIFPLGPGAVTREALLASVSDHGEMYSANPDRPGAIYFVTAKGRLEVYDERAVFQPNDRSATVRTAADGGSGAKGLTIVQVGDILAQAQSVCGNGLTPAQQQTLRVMLLQPQQDLVIPQRAKSAVKSVVLSPTGGGGGGATIQFAGGAIVTLGPMGQVMPAGQPDAPRASRAAFGVVEALAIASLGLAIFLLFCGTLALKRSSRTVRVMNVYAWAKVAVTVGWWIAIWWMLDDFVTRTIAASGGADVSTLPSTVLDASLARSGAVLFAVAGCVVPIALLLGVRTHAARDYFARRVLV